jgi:hypothetical protein
MMRTVLSPIRFARAIAAIALALFLPRGSIDGATIVSDTADFEPRLRTGGTLTPEGPYDPGPSVSATSLRIGFQTNFLITSAFFFRLPLLAPGETIAGADFSVTELPDSASTAVIPNHNADLVAVGFTNIDPPERNAPASERYFFVGEGRDDTAPGRAQIQDNFLEPSDFIPMSGSALGKATDDPGDAALLGYINDLYANSATNQFIPGTSYLILRLNPDLLGDSGTRRYTVASAENVVAGVTPPTLTLVIIPEPACAMLFLAGMAALGGRRPGAPWLKKRAGA